jgi:hypothetical protein
VAVTRLVYLARAPVPPELLAPEDLVVYPIRANDPDVPGRWQLQRAGEAPTDQEIDSDRLIEFIFAADRAVVW